MMMVMMRTAAHRAVMVMMIASHPPSAKAAERIVIDAPPTVGAIIAQIMDVDFHQSFLLSPAHDTFVGEVLQQFGQYGNDIYSHIPMMSVTLRKP